jgi:hypothetical protein
VMVDTKALVGAGIDVNVEVKIAVPGIKLRSLLKHLLEPLNLTYVIDAEVLKITTINEAKKLSASPSSR